MSLREQNEMSLKIFAKDKLSNPTEFSKDVPQNMDTKVTKTVTVPVADSSGNPAHELRTC